MAFRIFIESGSSPLHNHGDNAMLRMAVERLRMLWPESQISVVTSRPDRLEQLCPSANPVPEKQRLAWLSERSLSGEFKQKLPSTLSDGLAALEMRLWMDYPRLSHVGTTLKRLGKTHLSPRDLLKRLTYADLIFVSGMGLINDAFHDAACALLDELKFALLRNRTVVAFGQGIGPITKPELEARARDVLPKLKLIALRERRWGLPLLESLGVPRERIWVTGDDAIECAYNRRKTECGSTIGINVRLARYSTTDDAFLTILRSALYRTSESLGARLVPIPISFSNESSDVRAINKLLDCEATDLPTEIGDLNALIERIGNCRVMVTGSYHPAVFALAQGIPVVALIQSSYYEQKFSGLSDQFGQGCTMVDLRSSVRSDDIAQVICSAWKSAGHLRELLLKGAAMQIESSRAAYSAVYRLYSGEPDSAGQSPAIQYSSG